MPRQPRVRELDPVVAPPNPRLPGGPGAGHALLPPRVSGPCHARPHGPPADDQLAEAEWIDVRKRPLPRSARKTLARCGGQVLVVDEDHDLVAHAVLRTKNSPPNPEEGGEQLTVTMQRLRRSRRIDHPGLATRRMGSYA